jgi:hypothetical protein
MLDGLVIEQADSCTNLALADRDGQGVGWLSSYP